MGTDPHGGTLGTMAGDQQTASVSSGAPTANKLGSVTTWPLGLRGLWAVLTCLILLDAAVETFLSRSALSPIVAIAVTVFLGLSGLLWTRIRWNTRAVLPFLFILVLFSATAWMPGGLDHGIVMMRQPTSVVMTAITGVAVVVSGISLAVLTGPWWVRAFVATVAAYAGTGFGLALILHPSAYTALFHGHSFWSRAPFWLQAPYVGLALLLFSVVADLRRAVINKIQTREGTWRWQLRLVPAVAALIAAAAILPHPAWLAHGANVPLGPFSGFHTDEMKKGADRASDQSDASPVVGGPVTPEPESTKFNLALEENGGLVERITGDDVFGRPLVDGDPQTVCWVHAPVKEPTEILLSFYKRQTALLEKVAITIPDPAGPQAQQIGRHLISVPKDVEIWTSMNPDSAFQKIGVLSFTNAAGTQSISMPASGVRFLKLRVLSAQRDPFEEMGVGISEIQAFESRRPGYASLRDRNPDLANWNDTPRYSAQRGINWLQPATMKWQKNNKCFGCHIQAQSVMGLAVARRNGYVVNDGVIKELSTFTQSQQKPDGSYLREPNEPSTQFAAMGLAYYDEAGSINRDPVLLKTTDWLLAKQKSTGDMPYGDLGCHGDAVVQGPVMATANTLLALKRAYAETNDPRYQQAAERALSWISSVQPVSTQDEVFKILALVKFGGSDQKSTVQSLVERLLAEQRPNGGWRECPDHTDLQEPNPFSTGQVLYAFKQAGVNISSSAFIKGVKYLMSVQQPDGSWKVEPQVLHGQGAPYAPSMWAIIGLAGSFGDVNTAGLQIVAQTDPAKAPAARNIEIILDASGSMLSPLGKSTRIGTAREVLRDVLAKIPDDFNVGLRVYAHRYPWKDMQHSCTDTELVLPIQKLDRERILSTVDKVKPRGDTPLVYSVRQTPADLKGVGGGSVIVITDGQETCHGDPVTAVQELKGAGIPVTLNIVGFTLKGKEKQDVEQMMRPFAEATGGHYYYAEDGEALARALSIAALNKFPYEVFDSSGQQVAKGQAGPLSESLEAGNYKVVVHAGDQELTENVALKSKVNTVLKVVRTGEKFTIERQQE
jgi:prenyltransferase/squalene oxidase-like repeat protein